MSSFYKKSVSVIFLAFALFLASAAAYNGYFTKWAFQDGNERMSLDRMLDGTAYRPFVYRQLVPQIAKFICKQRSDGVNADYIKHRPYLPETFVRASLARDPRFSFTYRLVYYLSFASLFLCSILLYMVLRDAVSNRLAALIAVFISVLLMPIFMCNGGYFYDPVEWMFFAASFRIAQKHSPWWLLPLSAAATFNKESFLFFIPTLLPVLLSRFKKPMACGSLAVSMMIAIAVNIAVKHAYAMNPGCIMENHFIGNLSFYLNPHSYIMKEYNYSIPFPQGFNIFYLLLLASVLVSAWKRTNKVFRATIILSALINIPLLIIFCYQDELRNLSIMFVPLAVLLAQFIANIDRKDGAIDDQAH